MNARMTEIQARVAARLKEKTKVISAAGKREEIEYAKDRAYGEFFVKCAGQLAVCWDLHPAAVRSIYHQYRVSEDEENAVSATQGVREEFKYTPLKYLYPFSGSPVMLKDVFHKLDKLPAWQHFLRVRAHCGEALVPFKMRSRKTWVITTVMAERQIASVRLAIPIQEQTVWILPLTTLLKDYTDGEDELDIQAGDSQEAG